MKTFVSFTLLLVATMLFAGCKLSKKITTLQPYKDKELITKQIKVYEVKEWLYPILDSVILETEECGKYQKVKNKIAYSFQLGFGCDPNLVEFGIMLEPFPEYINHALWTEAIFYYKGYKFYCGHVFLDFFFKKTDKVISIICIDPEKYRYDIYNKSKSEMEWVHCIKVGSDVIF